MIITFMYIWWGILIQPNCSISTNCQAQVQSNFKSTVKGPNLTIKSLKEQFNFMAPPKFWQFWPPKYVFHRCYLFGDPLVHHVTSRGGLLALQKTLLMAWCVWSVVEVADSNKCSTKSQTDISLYTSWTLKRVKFRHCAWHHWLSSSFI